MIFKMQMVKYHRSQIYKIIVEWIPIYSQLVDKTWKIMKIALQRLLKTMVIKEELTLVSSSQIKIGFNNWLHKPLMCKKWPQNMRIYSNNKKKRMMMVMTGLEIGLRVKTMVKIQISPQIYSKTKSIIILKLLASTNRKTNKISIFLS